MTTFVILASKAIHPVDIPATMLHFMSRGKNPIAGESCRTERDELAAAVGAGPLADLLKSADAITVGSSSADRWEVKRVRPGRDAA